MSISVKERREIPDNKMGDPAHDKFPLDTPKRIRSAAKLIGHAEDEKQVAKNILRRAKEEGVSTDSMHKVKQVAGVAEQVPPMSDGTSLGNSPPRTMAPYYDEAGEQLAQRLASTSSQMSAGVSPTTEEDELMSRMNQIGVAHAEAIGKREMKAQPFQFAQKIVKEISAQVEKDSKPPTGNQNCQLCTWCAEARYRGINALPRPIYSPRDPALNIKGETIVMNPIKESFKSQKEVVRKVRGNVDSRWYVHVNWKDSTGGHEFLVININDYAYIMDAQAGLLKEIDELDSTHNYFRDINFKNSYMVRLDTRPFNTQLFNDVNNPANVMPWKNSLDIPYMRDNGMISPEDDSDPRFRRVFVPSEEGLKYLKEDPELSQYWEDMHKATNGEFLVDRETGEAIGHVFVHTNKHDKGFIFNVEVAPKYRRQGYGWILIDDAVRRFGGEDLTVDADNTPAINLYLQYGFTIYKKGQWHYDPPKDELWMKYDRSKLKPFQESVTQEDTSHNVSSQYKMRAATESDLEFVYQSELETVGENKNDPKVQKYIRKDAKESLGHTKIIVMDDADIGVYQAYETNYYGLREGTRDWWYLAHIYIKPEYRNLGIGSDIIKKDIKTHNKILLQVMKSNTRAKKLYESLGFVVDMENDHGGLVMRLDKSKPVQEGAFQESTNVFESGHFSKYKDNVLGFNDEGMAVMKKCDCGGKISIAMKGEPIYTCESCGKTYGCVPFQEGAFQDLKNGVNPYSDDLVFHVSPDKHIDGQVWKPRVPDYLDPYNPEDTGFEDNTTPRICFSTSIEGALNGITVNLQRQSPDTFDKMYVYVPEKPWKEYKHKTNKQLVNDKLVYDANVTREVWIMEPVRMKLYGVIRVDQIADAKRKSVVPTSKGQKDTRNYFTYKWHWVVKPKVLKKATKFDYSPERVIDDLCIDIKKFKYGLIKDGRLMTGNVSDADYDKYWVFHSGETVDQAGGGNCYDMVEYEAGYLEAFGVAYKKYFMNFTDTKNTKTLNTHTICVVPHDGKFIYIEQAFKRVVDEWGYERKKVFDKLTDIFEYVAEVSAECENQDINYGVWDYTDAEIDYGTPIKNFQEWIFNNCTMIHDGEAIISKPIKESFVIPARFSEYHYKEGYYV